MRDRRVGSRSKTIAIGASVAGPRHLSAGESNQDAWHAVHRAHGTMIVVSDGVGSAKYAAAGARHACQAATAVFGRLNPDSAAATFSEEVVAEWISRLSGCQPSECAATFLFGVRFYTGRMLVGGVGDGLVAVCHPRMPHGNKVVSRRAGEFGETYSLADRSRTGSWTIEEFDDSDSEHRVLLATDGVSNDLIESRIYDLTAWLHQKFARASGRGWRVGLRRELLRWPTPGSHDDKSLAMMWRVRGNST